MWIVPVEKIYGRFMTQITLRMVDWTEEVEKNVDNTTKDGKIAQE
jgi:hypothetical protein